MMTIPLSRESEKRLVLLFPRTQHDLVRATLLEKCGSMLPGLESVNDVTIDRYRFAVLKLSNGNIDKLNKAILLAQTDCRDLLVAAGFGENLTAHESWLSAKI